MSHLDVRIIFQDSLRDLSEIKRYVALYEVANRRNDSSQMSMSLSRIKDLHEHMKYDIEYQMRILAVYNREKWSIYNNYAIHLEARYNDLLQKLKQINRGFLAGWSTAYLEMTRSF